MNLWHAIFWVSYAAWALFEMWVFARDRHTVQGRRQDGASLYVVIGMIVLAICIVFWGPWLAPSARILRANPALPIIAALMMWGGMAFRLWAILTLGRFFRTTVTIQDEHRLVQAGPYRILRHPAYTGATVTIAGFGLFMNNWLSFVGALACVLIGYGVRIRIEERALQARFGDAFLAQRARSWAMIPFVW